MRRQIQCENAARLGVPVFANENLFEHSLTYERDGKRQELVLVHLPGQAPVLSAATFNGDDPNVPDVQLEMSLDEVRVRLAFLLKLKNAGLLD